MAKKHPAAFWSQLWKGAQSWYSLIENQQRCTLLCMLVIKPGTDRELDMDMNSPTQEWCGACPHPHVLRDIHPTAGLFLDYPVGTKLAIVFGLLMYIAQESVQGDGQNIH